MIKYWHQRRYTAWFDPEFEIDSADYSHADYNSKLERQVEALSADIAKYGLINPLLVTRKNGKKIIHPGKCRAKALKLLGISHAPAVVVDYDRVVESDAIPAGCKFLDSVEQTSELFRGDCRVEMSHRVLTVKKSRT